MPNLKRLTSTLLVCIVLIVVPTTLQAQRVADSLMDVGNYSDAIELYKAQPTSAVTAFKTAGAYVAMGNSSKAIEAYETGLKLDSTVIKAKFELGRLYLGANQSIKGVMIFNELSKTFPENATYHFYSGQGMEQLKVDNAAMVSYLKALELEPDYRRARVELVPLLIKNRKFEQAISYCKEILKIEPNDIKFNSLMAQAYFNDKQYRKAIQHLELLLSLGNDTEYNRKTLGLSYYENDQWQESITNFDLYLNDYEPGNALIYFYKSIAHLRLAEFDESQDAIEYAINYKRPAINQEYLQLATIHAAQENYKEVFTTLTTASKEYPEDRLIAYQLAVAADRYFKDKSAILTYYERFVDKFGKDDSYGQYAVERSAELKTQLFLNPED